MIPPRPYRSARTRSRLYCRHRIVSTETVLFLEGDNLRWPELSFRDFVSASVLAETLALKPEGRA